MFIKDIIIYKSKNKVKFYMNIKKKIQITRIYACKSINYYFFNKKKYHAL